MRANQIYEGYDDTMRIVRLPINNFDDMLTIILIVFMWTYKDNRCCKVAPMKLLDLKYENKWLLDDVVI